MSLTIRNIPSDMCAQRRFRSDHFLLGAFWIANGAKILHADNKDRSDCLDAQADFSLLWAHISGGKFSHDTAQIGSDYILPVTPF